MKEILDLREEFNKDNFKFPDVEWFFCEDHENGRKPLRRIAQCTICEKVFYYGVEIGQQPIYSWE